MIETDRHEKILFHGDGSPETVRGLKRLILRWALRGRTVCCPICEGRFSTFVPFRPFGTGLPTARCPQCGSLDRTRLLWLFLRQRTEIFGKPGTLLHVSPEAELFRVFSRMKGLTYIPCDKFCEGYHYARGTRAMDITAIPLADDTVDYILCSHVLEHIPDDRAAMRELRRVLHPGGWAVFLVPMDRFREETYEDPSVITPEDRAKAYWQHDHVRLYGKDFPLRLQSEGFDAEADNFANTFTREEAFHFGFRRFEKIYFCRKEPRRRIDEDRKEQV